MKVKVNRKKLKGLPPHTMKLVAKAAKDGTAYVDGQDDHYFYIAADRFDALLGTVRVPKAACEVVEA